MIPRILAFTLSATIGLQAFGNEMNLNVDKFKDLRNVVSAKCEQNSPKVLEFLEGSDYLSKRIQYLKLSIKYNKEQDELLEELKDDAAMTSNISKALFGVSAVILIRKLPGIQRVVPDSIISKAWVKGNAVVARMIPLPNTASETIASVAYYKAYMASAYAAMAGLAYISYIEPFVETYRHWNTDARSEREARRLFLSIQNDFDNGHDHLKQLRDEVDLDYSRLADGLTLGSKSKNATEELYTISKAKTLLYQTELNYLLDVQKKMNNCK